MKSTDSAMTDPRLFDGAGCWLERLATDVPVGRPALFLDRDGVIVEEAHYLSNPADVRLIAGAAEAIARCNGSRIPVVAITNQSGIARGYYDWTDFAAVQAELIARLAAAGARLDAVAACAYHDTGSDRYRVPGHAWRKPNPGMIHAVADLLQVDLARSVLVGDKRSDIEAGIAAGLARCILVRTGYGCTEEEALPYLVAGTTAVTATDRLGDVVADLLATDWRA
ncbi:MAG: HAD-IIIA family hydrolase [Rhodoplanes sp.]|uniref:D-glycero-alpha-D-manno-heptose-1,7-bisphosphate 7-phosphatase n=1 Tax=Rhodoplanes sp. TaxID=1968906 RepID=UPI001845A004|nr:HAD-IIIA family hydrolase [Rhodoplanes sp.]NVO16257.1 HAD-IIIA family hydrolase [Rhodoplanes sp.]